MQDAISFCDTDAVNDREYFVISAWLRETGRDVMRGLRHVIGNELGQMSIFLALVFQVLFVFFAMVINIGLLVHDKINLQNAVDLGAYYAAQRQAEILNEIAHLNYEIRQEYKLLAFRYNVIGTLGRDNQDRDRPPVRRPVGSPIPPDLYRVYGSGEEVPVTCLAHPIWYEFASLTAGGGSPNENYCWHNYGFVSGSIAIGPAGGPPATAALNAAIAAMARASRQAFIMSCQDASPLSWAYAVNILGMYKFAIAQRKQKIWSLRARLVSENMLDRDQQPVKVGVEKTIKKNLTEENLQSFAGMEVINGLTRGGCDGGVMPGENTLPEIRTAPGLYYALLQGASGSCSFQNTFQNDISRIQGNMNQWDPSGLLRQLSNGEPLPSDPTHSSLGFEKNPWCMSWVGVRAKTKPRKPFAPFGNAITLEARAFAQPFGGRVGPWYGKSWVRSQFMSESPPPPTYGGHTQFIPPAPGQAGRTDPLTSPRVTPGMATYAYNPYTVPNYSRFPGDQWGMRSQRAQAMGRYLISAMDTDGANPSPAADNRLKLNWFLGWSDLDSHGDSLAWDAVAYNGGGSPPPGLLAYRQLEMAAVAPDLFDITYYSVDPRGAQNYYQLQEANPARYTAIPPVRPGVPIGDLGTRFNYPQSKSISVEDQIGIANANPDQALWQSNFWNVRDWRHLLTGWAPHRASNFNFPVDRFGNCPDSASALPNVMIPGYCVAGGRVGYSVRIISRAHLLGQWSIGGDGQPAQSILNPPPGDTDF